MKTILILSASILFCLASFAQQTLHPKHGTIWLSWEEGGHQWMVGAIKDYAIAHDDPGIVQTDFGKEYSVKVQGHGVGDGILFHNCCTTNISIATNYTGTITIGTNTFKVSELLKSKPLTP